MDQNAFRSLLSSGAASSSSTSKNRGVLGAPAPRRGGWGIKAKPGHEYKAPEEKKEETKPGLAPRQWTKKSGYKDRAEMRRKGVEDEYQPVSGLQSGPKVVKMLEDFEKRQVEAGANEEDIERTRAMLGGDATHSILVKGLDYSLLAARKAELAQTGEEIADEELEALIQQAKPTKAITEVAQTEKKEEVKKEALGKGFKSIVKKDEGGELKKKKKMKKKVVPESSAPPAESASLKSAQKADSITGTLVEPQAGPSKPTLRPEPAPPPEEDDDEDIFGDAGAYDLTAGRPDDDSSSEEEGQAKGDERESRSLSRSRSGSPDSRPRRGNYSNDERGARHRRRGSSASRDSRDHYQRRARSRSSSYDSRDRYAARDRDEPRHRNSRREQHDSSQNPLRRERHRASYSRSRSRSIDRDRRTYHDERDRKRQRRSSTPPRRQKTRSLSPIAFDPLAGPPRSPSPSDDEDDMTRLTGKLQPLSSSAVPDLKGFLSAEAAAAKAEEKRLRKAKWRAQQGLGMQEGSEDLLSKESRMNDKQKQNRDYVLLMNKLKKGEEAGDAGGGGEEE